MWRPRRGRTGLQPAALGHRAGRTQKWRKGGRKLKKKKKKKKKKPPPRKKIGGGAGMRKEKGSYGLMVVLNSLNEERGKDSTNAPQSWEIISP